MAPVQSKDLVPSANSSGNSNAVITKPKVSRYQTFKRLLSFASPDLSKIIIGILALAVNGATNLSFPWIIGKAVDNAAAETLKEFVTNSAGFFVAGALASWLRVYCLGIAGENISNRLRLEVFNAILKQEIEYYESTELGEIVSLLDTDIHVSSSLLTETISSILRSFNSAVNGSVLLYRTSPSLCAVSLSVAPVVGVAGMGFAIYSSKLTKASRNFQSQISSHSLERFRNISTVRLNNRENYEISHLSKLLEESRKLANKRYHASGSFMSFTNIATNCSLIAVLRYGGLMIARGELSVGTLTSFAIQTAFVGLGFSGLATAYSSFIKGLDATERIFEVIDQSKEYQKKYPETSSQSSTETPLLLPPITSPTTQTSISTKIRAINADNSPSYSINVDQVSFCYKKRSDIKIFDNLSLTIPSNQITAFVGKSGAGKSTLAALLSGLYTPTSGQIVYGANHSKEDDDTNNVTLPTGHVSTKDLMNKKVLYNVIGVVEQSHSTLFTGSIEENIAYGKLNATKEEIVAAAVAAHAHEFICSFPDQYNTQVGSDGCMLSGGQKARIALARALIKQPKYLILDEPTAALDMDSEQEIIPPLLSLKQHTTIVLFTHSDKLKSIADSVYSVAEGKLTKLQH